MEKNNTSEYFNTGYGQDRRDFEKNHADELGMQRYVYTGVRNFVIPVGAMVAGGAAGYYLLGKPVAKLAPRLVEALDGTRSIAGVFKGKSPEEVLNTAKRVLQAFPEIKITSEIDDITGQTVFKKAGSNKELSATDAATEIWGQLTSPEQKKKFWDALEFDPSKSNTANWIGAGVGGMIGSTIGGTIIGYEQWKRDEMTRVAAREVNKDISQLQLFRPTDNELQKEVVRLRGMVDELQQQNMHNTTALSSPSTQIHGAADTHIALLEEPPQRTLGS